MIKKLNRLLITLTICGLVASCGQPTPEEYLNQAKQAIEKQQLNEAVIALKNVIREQPELAEARFLLGQVYLSQQQYPLAEKELNKALELNYPADKVLPLLSQSYNKSGADVALTKLKFKQQGLRPAQAAEIGYYKVKAFIKLQQPLKAQQLLDELKALDTQSVYKKLLAVLSLVNQQQIELALQQLSALQQQYPKEAEVLSLTASLLLQQNKPQQALPVLEQYYALNPEDEQRAFQLIQLLLTLDQSEKAEPIIDQLLTRYEKQPLLAKFKAMARFEAKDYQQSLNYSEQAIAQQPEDNQLRLIAGYSAYFLQDYAKANQHLSLIVTELPPNHPALRLLAYSQLKLGLSIEASETLSKVDQYEQHDAFLLSSAGIALSQQGEYAKAKALLEKSEQVSESPADNAQLGVLKLSLNDQSGIANIETALSDEKLAENENYQRTLATAYLSTKQYDKALELADSWLKQNPNNVTAYIVKAAVYKLQKNLQQAQTIYQQALAIAPDNLTIKVLLADINYLMGEVDEAKAMYQQIVQQQPQAAKVWQRLYAIARQQQQTTLFIKELERQVADNQQLPQLKLTLAQVYLAEKQLDKSEQMLTALTQDEITQVQTQYWPTLAQVYIQQQQYSKAKQHYKQWLAEQPKSRQALLGNLILLDLTQEYEQALQLAQPYLERVGSDTVVELLASHFLVALQRFDEAEKQIKQLPQAIQQTPLAQEVFAEIALSQKNYVQAIALLKQAYEKRPAPRTTRLLAMSYALSGQTEQAYQLLLQHRNKQPNDVASLMLLADFQLSKDKSAAIETYNQVINIAPQQAVALNNLAYLYLEKNQLDLAQQYGEKAVALSPNNSDVLDTLAQIYLAKQQNEPALKLLTKAVTQANVRDDVFVNYIQALLASEQTTLAQKKISQREIKNAQAKAKLVDLMKEYGLHE
jgi:putative PEP-CTERM system TPR-repeat lipoprotein